MTQAAGAQVEILLEVDKDPAAMWDLVTDVTRIGEWSPECVGGIWLDAPMPRPGARFEGRNAIGEEFRSTVTCVVTEAQRPAVFEWIVLDPTLSPDTPGSTWRYELTSGRVPGQTTVLHRFVHGPGATGLSAAMQEQPDQARQILQGRLDQLRANMTVTLEAMARD